MADSKLTRRGLLLGGICSIPLVKGSIDFLSGNEFKKNYTTHGLEEPVVEGGPTPETGSPFFASIVDSESKAQSVFRTELLDEQEEEEWESVDYSSEFVAVFISRYYVTPPGVVTGDNPETRSNGDVFRFVVDSNSVEYAARDSLYTQIERWDSEGSTAPRRAEVVLNFG